MYRVSSGSLYENMHHHSGDDFMANWAYIEDNEEDPAAWRIESIEYHPGEPAVTHCFTDARMPVDKGTT